MEKLWFKIEKDKITFSKPNKRIQIGVINLVSITKISEFPNKEKDFELKIETSEQITKISLLCKEDKEDWMNLLNENKIKIFP